MITITSSMIWAIIALGYLCVVLKYSEMFVYFIIGLFSKDTGGLTLKNYCEADKELPKEDKE